MVWTRYSQHHVDQSVGIPNRLTGAFAPVAGCRRRRAGLPIVREADGPMSPSYGFGLGFFGFGASLISFTGTAFACGAPGVLRPLAMYCSSSWVSRVTCSGC